jgi:hypothetical protein
VALAASAGLRPVAARLLPVPDHVALIVAHAAVRGAVPLIVVAPSDDREPNPVPELNLRHVPGPVIVWARTSRVRLDPDRPLVTVPVGPVAAADRRAAWLAAFPALTDEAAATLATRHPIDPALVAQVALDSGPRGARTSVPAREIVTLIRRRAGANLPPGVQLVTPEARWERLVLPEPAESQLRAAVGRLPHQALVLDDWGMRTRARAQRGARLLFTGPPGTGKTLAAEVIAAESGTDLMRIDTSQVVSKWVGETEKNLGEAFDIAERTQALLFLDEADALFGARTEISDANDRYANLETAYLLQRIDQYEGLVALATNLRHNIDPAFLRRMDFVVDFPLPDIVQRQRLWQLHLPAEQTDPEVDVDTLARLYPIPGGWIRNAAIAAAFAAAAGERTVRMRHVVSAVQDEYVKAALPFPGEPPRRRDDR